MSESDWRMLKGKQVTEAMRVKLPNELERFSIRFDDGTVLVVLGSKIGVSVVSPQ